MANIRIALLTLLFMSQCSTGIKNELKSYIEHLKKDDSDFSRIKKHEDIGLLIKNVCDISDYKSIYNLMSIFENKSFFKIYRKELFYEMLRSIKYAYNNGVSTEDAAVHVRNDINLKRSYSQFKFLSSRTLLSKGLEFDCVIIDMSDKYTAKEFYVALTRAKHKIYIISDSNNFSFKC